ncbi:MAG: HAMP domain-containing sensor histidine kinase [Thermoanaerobacteraceae bacterium]
MKGIQKKLFTSYITIAGLILSLFWLTQVVFISNIYSYYKINQLKNYSEKIVDALNNNDESLISELIDKSNARVIAVSGSDIIISSGGRGKGTGIPESLINSGKDLKVVKYEHPFLHIEYLSILRPFIYNGKASTLIMSIPISTISDTVSLFKEVFWVIFAVTIAITIATSIYMSKKFTKPIEKLKNIAKQISSGNLNVKINNVSDDELGDLANSMNLMAKQLSINDKLQKDLIANITHDLKTPLGLLRGYSEMLLDYYGNDKDKREKYLNIMIKETERMSKLVDGVLQLSKLQSGVIKTYMETFNLKTLVSEILDIFEIQIQEKNIQIILKDLKFNVKADREMIKRVLINIINNSINSIEKDGKIEIEAIQNQKEVLIKISDTGHGIPKKDLPNIFNKYYKGNKSGTGLGLAIVKEILNLHESKYGFESTEGVGTTFHFTLKAEK